jgi:hypothetical protein
VLRTTEFRSFVRLGALPSAGTSLLDYKRGVPVARPRKGKEVGGKDKENQEETEVLASATATLTATLIHSPLPLC